MLLLMTGLVGSVQATAPGDLDTTFGTSGAVFTDFGVGRGDKAYAVAIDSGGEIVVAGSSDSGIDADLAVVRYGSTGTLDGDFGTGGQLITPIGDSDDVAYSVAIQADGRIVVAGSTFNGVDNDLAVVRYTITGTLDTLFNGTGIVTTTINGNDVARAVAIQLDGNIVVAGFAGDDYAIVRYTSEGDLDSGFGGGDGIVTTDFAGAQDRAHAVAIQPDGKLVVAGYSDSGHSDDFAVARYLTNGNLDNTFFVTGRVTTDFSGNSVDQAYSVAIQSDGKIVLAGFTNTGGPGGTDDFGLARYTSSGILDAAFSLDGRVTTPIGSLDDQAYSVAIQGTGKIVVAGFSDNKVPTHQDYSLARYTITGTLDAGFGATGVVTTDLGTIDNPVNPSADQAYAAAIQSDSRIVVVGYSDHPAGNDNFAVVRYESPNNAPVVSDVDKPGIEDTDVEFATADFTTKFTDADGDVLTKISVTSLPANGTLLLSSTPVTQNQEIPGADLDQLTFAPDENWNGLTTFGWNGYDGIAYAATGASVNITTDPINDVPTVSDIPDQSTTAGTPLGPVGFTVGDVETPVDSLTLSGESSNIGLVPTSSITFGGSGADRTVPLHRHLG